MSYVPPRSLDGVGLGQNDPTTASHRPLAAPLRELPADRLYQTLRLHRLHEEAVESERHGFGGISLSS